MTSASGRLPGLPILVALQALVAAASLVVEIVAGRMLAPYVGMSLYTWTSVIAVVLAGFSAGHWLGGLIAAAPPDRALRQTGWALVAAAVTTGVAVALPRAVSEPVLTAVANPVGAIVALTVAVFFLPSFFAGVPAPVLAQIAVIAAPERSGPALGAMFAAGALGAIAGTLLAGFLFISWIGSAGTLTAITLVYALLAGLCLWLGRASPARLTAGIAAGALATGLGAGGLRLADPCTEESQYFCIRVVDVAADPARPVNLLVLDHLVHGIAARDVPEVMFNEHGAMLDDLTRLRMDGRPFSAFIIGGGSYALPRAWALREPEADVLVAEIDPAVTRVAERDLWMDPSGIGIVHGDARRVLAAEERRFDVIVGDAFTDIAVPPHLVTEEFFALVAARLAPGGVYLMNVIDHTDRMHALAAILRSMEPAFPVREVWTEKRPAGPAQRKIFVVLGAATPTPVAERTTLAPGPFTYARLSQDWQDRLTARPPHVVLTDDFAPIDRLMRFSD